MLKDVKIVIPKLILDEECHNRTNGTKKPAGIGYRVERQISNDVCTPVVFAYFIARRREECKQNLIFRMVSAQLLHQRTSLLELPQ